MTIKKDTDVEDEEVKEDEKTKVVVKQKIKGTLFRTETTMTTTLEDGTKMKEESYIELELKEGTRLVWLEGKGYILPNEKFMTMHEIGEEVEALMPLDIPEEE